LSTAGAVGVADVPRSWRHDNSETSVCMIRTTENMNNVYMTQTARMSNPFNIFTLTCCQTHSTACIVAQRKESLMHITLPITYVA